MKRIFIVTQNDLVYYPPTQTLIMIMLKMGLKVVFVGNFSDEQAKKDYEKQGVVFKSIVLDESGNALQKILRRRDYSKNISKYLQESNINQEDLIWYIYSGATVCSLYKIFENYNYVVHFYEFFKSIHSWRYKYMYPSYSLENFLQKAKGVIHCEYNRAQICRALYGLEEMPYIIPNKPYIDESKLNDIPDDIKQLIVEFDKKTEGKRLVIYQGYFNAKERRLEEFCQAVALLPEKYVLVIMGRGNAYFDSLRNTYESDRIIFIPFIRPPYHLLITQKASIGILTYHPQQRTYPGVINPLYCAPNKIYEYGMYGIPMLGNDIPGLKYIFNEFKCGKTLSYPVTPQSIADSVKVINNYYNNYSDGAKNLYNAVNIEDVVTDILHTI